ncbi:MAG: aminopeptidase P family protein [Candidatus Eisenbacteria bacterium]|uniref:Aminopeptidase P family protein n=1 Tax=Eiseniibacteriota bacterium TaxID=2212470 RepID=A0A948RZJ2_UNCEI|nr:aminopeptidase P family protein [Candidatus Eisenbacteria bacterium]MBU1947342.1 aminopeptidase P family protein [Candidatus Eisenbacteria bacterium]MBU2692067.1 aminopeptidase P family protein [Candidatus Eisenbacteria bacterium]
MSVKKRVQALRQQMKKHNISAYLVPSTDPHQSEYVPECWQRRPWISGFTGSAGDVVVGATEAGLWTDGRYFLQAEDELKGSGIQLYKMGLPGVPQIDEYLARILKKGELLGVDPRTISLERSKGIEKALEPTGARLKCIDTNLVDEVWADRPSIPRDPIRLLPARYAGETVSSKLGRLRTEMKNRGAKAHLLTTLDSIAWLYNIRGNDVDFNPVAISYALIMEKKSLLFVETEKVPKSVAAKLRRHITIRPYGEIQTALKDLAKKKTKIWVDGASVSRWVIDMLKGCDLVMEMSPIRVMQAKKNDVQVAGMKAAHIRDGVAMVRFLHWLEREVTKGGLTEIRAADRLARFRSEEDLFQGLGFRTISGYAAHGAIIHYGPTPESDLPLRPKGIYLIDSGGQYLDGTTDITRTILLGPRATAEQQDRFTRVLKGHIALASVRFPAGILGGRLDTLARLPLWDAGLDYNHGTGHGVGAYLSVHEGPQNIGIRTVGKPLEPGNTLSNEPGFYKEGEYGMRIENLILVVEDKQRSKKGRSFLGFETITMCPIDTRLVDVRLLDEGERDWLNQYHKTVYKNLSGRLDLKDRAWLKKACRTL